jgi:hypothetical protein
VLTVKGSEVQGFWVLGSEVHGFRVQRFRGSWVLGSGFRGSEVQEIIVNNQRLIINN